MQVEPYPCRGIIRDRATAVLPVSHKRDPRKRSVDPNLMGDTGDDSRHVDIAFEMCELSLGRIPLSSMWSVVPSLMPAGILIVMVDGFLSLPSP